MRGFAAPAAALLLLAGCAEPEPPAPGEAIRFGEGAGLEGELRGSGDVAVVLAPGYRESRGALAELAEFLADRDFLTLAFDFGPDLPATPDDVAAAVAEVRARGARAVVLVGAGTGGSAALLAASGEDLSLEGVVTLSAPATFLGLEVTDETMSGVEEAKLFFAAEGDGLAQANAEAFYAASQPPKRVEVLVGDDHGSALLEGREAERVRNLILAFIQRYAEG